MGPHLTEPPLRVTRQKGLTIALEEDPRHGSVARREGSREGRVPARGLRLERLVVKAPIDESRPAVVPRLDHRDDASRSHAAGRLVEELRRASQVMQDVRHQHAAQRLVGEGQRQAVEHRLEAGKRYDIGANRIRQDLVEEPRS